MTKLKDAKKAYVCEYMDAQGVEGTEIVFSDDEDAAQAQIRAKGYFITSCKEIPVLEAQKALVSKVVDCIECKNRIKWNYVAYCIIGMPIFILAVPLGVSLLALAWVFGIKKKESL